MLFLDNPILRREFQSAARSGKTYSFAGSALLVLSLVIYALWPRSGIFAEANSTELFAIFLGAELTFMLLLTAGVTASSITSERERNTFVMLQTTLLSPLEIMSGKLLGSLGISFVLFFLTVPVASVCSLSGGISIILLLKSLAIIALSTLVYGLLGLAISSICRRSYISIMVTYISMALLAGATWLPSMLVKSELLKPYLLKLRAISPYEALFALQFSEQYENSVHGASSSSVFVIFISAMLIMALLFFLIFAKSLFARPRFSKSGHSMQYDDKKTAIKRKLGWPFYLIDPMKRKKPIGNHSNPVFIAELRSKIFGNPRFIARALSACICISLGLLVAVLYQVGEIELDKIRVTAIFFQMGMIALLAPAVSSGSITDERTSDTLLQLRLSPLTSINVVLGKMKASFVYVIIFLLSSLPVLIVLTLLENMSLPQVNLIPDSFSAAGLTQVMTGLLECLETYWRICAWAGLLLCNCLLLISAGLCASCFAANTAMATAVSYGFTLLISVCSSAVLLLGERASGTLQAACLIFNPFAASLDISLDNSMLNALPHLFGHSLWINHIYLSLIFTVIMLFASAFKVNLLFKEQK